MIKIDLITGFLGAGKTTFIRNYAKYLIDQGLDIGILENDFGAVNVDAMLLQDILGEHCTLEMVAGGCDADCHRRRFKTKLIAMGMCGYDRILVEPSGIFDMDEFFDVLHEDPLERWYEIGNVITIIDAGLEENLSEASRYILASQTAHAGAVLYSHIKDVSEEFLKQSCEEILKDSACGKVFRIKGFQKFPDGRWISINATHQGIEMHPVESGQEVLIVIGENLNKEAIEQYWGKFR